MIEWRWRCSKYSPAPTWSDAGVVESEELAVRGVGTALPALGDRGDVVQLAEHEVLVDGGAGPGQLAQPGRLAGGEEQQQRQTDSRVVHISVTSPSRLLTICIFDERLNKHF